MCFQRSSEGIEGKSRPPQSGWKIVSQSRTGCREIPVAKFVVCSCMEQMYLSHCIVTIQLGLHLALFGLGLDDVKLWPLFVCAQAGLAMYVLSNIKYGHMSFLVSPLYDKWPEVYEYFLNIQLYSPWWKEGKAPRTRGYAAGGVYEFSTMWREGNRPICAWNYLKFYFRYMHFGRLKSSAILFYRCI